MSRFINELLDSNQVHRFELLDRLCKDDDIHDEISVSELRAFIAMLYLGRPPAHSMFNSDGSPMSTKKICKFLKLKTRGRILNFMWSVVKKSFAFFSVAFGFAMVNLMAPQFVNNDVAAGVVQVVVNGHIIRQTVGKTNRENRQAADRNKRTVRLLLESAVVQCVQQTPDTHVDGTSPNETRVNIMAQADFTMYMIITVDGHLREGKDMYCAARVMTRHHIESRMREYNEGGTPVQLAAWKRPTLETPVVFEKFVPNVPDVPEVDDLEGIECSAEQVRKARIPERIKMSDVRVMLVSRTHVHVDKKTGRPKLLQIAHYGGGKIEHSVPAIHVCGRILRILNTYMHQNVPNAQHPNAANGSASLIGRLWSTGKIKLTFSKVKKSSQTHKYYYLMIVRLPSKYMPIDRKILKSVKSLAKIGIIGASLFLLRRNMYHLFNECPKKGETAYHIIKLKPTGATVQSISKARRGILLINHPDKNLNDKEGAEERTKTINNAVDELLGSIKDGEVRKESIEAYNYKLQRCNVSLKDVDNDIDNAAAKAAKAAKAAEAAKAEINDATTSENNNDDMD